jgi:predicted XRE-type DNA-binding protein
MSNREDSNIRRGSSNVFADLGYSDPDTHLLKAQLVSRIDEIIREQKLNQTQAAQIMGLSQPDVSRLLKGQFREVSVERIMRMLTRLGCDVDIVIKLPGHTRSGSVRQIVSGPNASNA